MALLATQQVNLSGITPTFAAAAAGGDKFTPGDTTIIELINGSGAAITVTVDSKVNSNQGTDVNPTATVAAGARHKIGPFPAQRFGGNDGQGDITYSGVTSLTVGVFA